MYVPPRQRRAVLAERHRHRGVSTIVREANPQVDPEVALRISRRVHAESRKGR